MDDRTATHPTPHLDPRQVRSRALILDAATEHFLRHGYLAGNIDVLAAEAGVAKRTVYNLFESKGELFRAAVGRAIATAESFVAEHVEVLETPGATFAADFDAFAVAHARAVLTPRVLATRRMLIGESARFPELAVEYVERVPGRVIAAIAAMLGRLAEEGHLRVPDPQLAADHFAYLVLGATLDRALFDPAVLDPARIDEKALAGARAFRSIYARR